MTTIYTTTPWPTPSEPPVARCCVVATALHPHCLSLSAPERTVRTRHARRSDMIRCFIAGFVAWLAIAAAGAATAQEPLAVAAKSAGVVRIGIVKPQVTMGSDDGSNAADSVRLILADYLQGPTIEVVLLGSRLASQYAIEAAQADCDFVLSVSLAHERGRMNQMLGRTLGNLTVYAPIHSGDISSAVVTGAIYSAADFAASIRARDEMQLDFRLGAAGDPQPVLTEKVKRRAKSDGEDLLTPLVERAAEAVGAAVAAHQTGAPDAGEGL